MPINIAEPPPAVMRELEATLPRIAARPVFSLAAPNAARAAATFSAERAQASSVEPSVSSPVYTVELDAIAAGRGLDTARLILWTHLLPTGGRGAAAGEVLAENHRFAALTEGPFVDDLRREVERLMAHPALAARSLDLAMLRVPPLYLNAIWLRDRAGRGDILIPIGQVYPPLRAGQWYSPEELMGALRGEAARLLNTRDTQGG